MFWGKKQYLQAYILRYFANDFISLLFWKEVRVLVFCGSELTSVFGYRHEPE